MKSAADIKQENIADLDRGNEAQMLGGSVINLEALFDRESRTPSQIILAIFEICVLGSNNSFRSCSPDEITFWADVMSDDFFQVIFEGFSADALLKVWKEIKSCGNLAKFLQIVQENDVEIDLSKMKLIQIIHQIKAFINSNNNETSRLFLLKQKKSNKKNNKKIRNKDCKLYIIQKKKS